MIEIPDETNIAYTFILIFLIAGVCWATWSEIGYEKIVSFFAQTSVSFLFYFCGPVVLRALKLHQ